MSSQIIGLIAHPGKPGAKELVAELIAEFEARGAVLRIEMETGRLVSRTDGLRIAGLGQCCDILVVMGGDGTILQVVHDLGQNIKPVFGINLGSLGFLTCVSSTAHSAAVDSICAGNFILSKRTLLRVEVEREGEIFCRRTGLNDVVMSRGSLSRLIRLETRIDGSVLTEYNADGLIVATPTGSTAYSLAAGGPILVPDSGVFVITPISPHVLTNRTVIVSDTALVEVRPRQKEADVFLTVDGQELRRLQHDDIIRISKAPQTLPLAMLPDTTFFEVLRQKLKWSGSAL